MKPDTCTSLNCSNFGCDYCQDCSHAIFWGEGKDRNGKLWRWEFNPRFGPTFLRKDLEFLINQPEDENHPCWEPFEKWLKNINNKKGNKNV